MGCAADLVVVAAWLVVLAHNAVLAVRGVARSPTPGRWATGLVVLVVVIVAGTTLERANGGRAQPPILLTVAGTLVTVAGAILHVQARRVLGSTWSSSPSSPPVLVDRGPYGRVRHPLYAALALMGVGTVAAHPSLATLAGGVGLLVGLGMKTRQEERALATTLGPDWEAYRRRVPCLVPRRHVSL